MNERLFLSLAQHARHGQEFFMICCIWSSRLLAVKKARICSVGLLLGVAMLILADLENLLQQQMCRHSCLWANPSKMPSLRWVYELVSYIGAVILNSFIHSFIHLWRWWWWYWCVLLSVFYRYHIYHCHYRYWYCFWMTSRAWSTRDRADNERKQMQLASSKYRLALSFLHILTTQSICTASQLCIQFNCCGMTVGSWILFDRLTLSTSRPVGSS